MSEFVLPLGFEDVWRPVASPKLLSPNLHTNSRRQQSTAKSRLSRIVGSAPEVVVRVTGSASTSKALRSHLDYISRRGDLVLEGPEHEALAGRTQIQDLAADWAWGSVVDSRGLERSPISRSLVFSMPAATDAAVMMDAVRCFAAWEFGGAFDYVLVLHTDTGRPHVHAAVRALGRDGERLNPGKADLERWRQDFAQDLRNRGVEAEALPRRARGIVLKPERMALRQIRKRYEAGDGPKANVMAEADLDAATTFLKQDRATLPWEAQIRARQEMVRSYYLQAADLLAASAEPTDQRLAHHVRYFIASMPKVTTRHQMLEDDHARAHFCGQRERGARTLERERVR